MINSFILDKSIVILNQLILLKFAIHLVLPHSQSQYSDRQLKGKNMKTSTKTLIYGLGLISGLTITSPVHAENISDLKLDCKGSYQVISASPYFKQAPTYPTRAPILAYAGAQEQIKILTLNGSGCAKLKPSYGIDLQIGMILPYSAGTSPATADQAKVFAQKELGKTYSFKASQTFQYALPDGTLPFFPMIHTEYAQILNLSGNADTKGLYGTPSIEDLDDGSKNKIAAELLSMKDWGLVYQSYNQQDGDQWLQLLLKLEFKNPALELEHIQNLVLVFNNMVKKTTQFYISTPSNLVAKQISFLLNKYGKSKWSTKIEILKMNPAILNQQGVTWSNTEEVLNLTSSEIEEFLAYTLVQVQNLSKVSQVGEARVLKSQYQGAAAALNSTPLTQDKHFDLSPKSQELIALIVSL